MKYNVPHTDDRQSRVYLYEIRFLFYDFLYFSIEKGPWKNINVSSLTNSVTLATFFAF